MRDGPFSGSFGGGNGSGKSGIMLYHFLGNSSTGSDIWVWLIMLHLLVKRALVCKPYKDKISAYTFSDFDKTSTDVAEREVSSS